MKNLKNLPGVEVLSKNEKKSLNGGGGGRPIDSCYCPNTGIFAGYDYGDGCQATIEENCLLDS